MNAPANYATTVEGPDGTAYFRLASLKGMLRLEKVGMKTRGGALRPRIAAEFGLKKNDPHDKFIAEIQKRMDVLLAKKHAQDAEAQA